MIETEQGIEISHTTARKTHTLVLVNVEDRFVGMSLTEREGLNMRRVAIEIHDVNELRAMRDFLDLQLQG